MLVPVRKIKKDLSVPLSICQYLLPVPVSSGMSGPMRVEDPVSSANSLVQPWQPDTYYTGQQQQFDIDCGTSQVGTRAAGALCLYA